jgi:hypothetical protein
MTNFQPSATATDALQRPPCPKCGMTMMIARIEPHTDGYDMRTFECPSCDHSESVVVKFN